MIAAPHPARVQEATNNLLAAIQERIVALRREADALERDVNTVLAASAQRSTPVPMGPPATLDELAPVAPPHRNGATPEAPGQ